MSRNKDIKLLHHVSGKSYKECRQIMKSYHWQLGPALLPYSDPAIWESLCDVGAQALGVLADALENTINSLCTAVGRVLREYAKVMSEIDWEDVLNRLDK